MARSLSASAELQQASPASSRFNKRDYGIRRGYGGLNEASHGGGGPMVTASHGESAVRPKEPKETLFLRLDPRASHLT